MAPPTRAVRVSDPSGVGEARRECAALCREAGLDETTAGRAAVAVTELATNLVRHAGGGRILLRRLASPAGRGVEVLALDSGPGMVDPGACLRDGYSSAGSSGTGLGAVRRLSSEFDIHSVRGLGTAILSRHLAPDGEAQRPGPRRGYSIGAACLPCHDRDPSGDAWAIVERPGGLVLLVVDGVGHGPAAAEVAGLAVRAFERSPDGPTSRIAEVLHATLRGTRGAALSVAELDAGRREVRFTGVGNVSGRIHGGGESRLLVCHDGTAGGEVRRFQEFTYPWPDDGLLILHTDGLLSRWSLSDTPGLAARRPAVIAGVLARDRSRGRDDVTVVVVKEGTSR